MRRKQLNLRVTFVIVLVSLVIAYLLYIAAQHITHNGALQAILENLSADTIVIAFTVTVIDAWTRLRDHKDYEATEQQTIRDVQDRVYLCISVVMLQLEAAITGVESPFKVSKNDRSYVYIMYAGARDDLQRVDYGEVTVAMTNDVLQQIQKAVDDIDRVIMTYEKSLQGTSFQALRAIHRKLDRVASPGLHLLAQGVGLAIHAKDDEKLKKSSASALQSKINDLLEIGKKAEALSQL